MGNIGDSFGVSVPTVGTVGPGYASSIDTILTEVMARLSTKVPLASLSFNSTLDLTGQAMVNAAYITLQNTSSSPGSSPVNRLTAYLGNLWYVSPTGALQISNGAALNAAGIGGITGDYGGANPAQFRFVDANQRYDAYDDFAGGAWGFVRSLGFDIAAGATSANYLRLASAGGATRTYTFPATPASSADPRPLYIDNSGNITVGHTTAKSYPISAMGLPLLPNYTYVNGGIRAANTGNEIYYQTVQSFPIGFTFTAFTNHFTKPTANASTYRFQKQIAGTVTTLASGSSVSTGNQNAAVSLGVAEVVAANTTYWVEYTFSNSGAGGVGEIWYGATVTGNLPS